METFNDIISGEVLTLVDFYATWCGPCKTMHPILEQVKEKLGDKIRIIKIDVDKHQELSLKYNIQAVRNVATLKNAVPKRKTTGNNSLTAITIRKRNPRNEEANFMKEN